MSDLALDPAAVVQRQLDAYNARDLVTLVETYAEDAQIFEHPSKLLAQGSAEVQQRYEARFKEPNLRATLLHRIVVDAMVVDHERVTRSFAEGPGEIEVIMIYRVQDGRIATAWMIPGPRRLRPAS